MRSVRQTKIRRRAAFGVVLFCAMLAHAQSDAPLSEVRVEAQREALARHVNLYVRGITRNLGAADQESLVRWNTPICLFPRGLSADAASTLLDRLAEVIAAAGAPLHREPCQPNFIIVVTSEPDQVLEGWYAHDPHLFGDAAPSEIRHFLESPSNPIRVWRNIHRGRVATTRFGHFVPSNIQADSSPLATTASLDFDAIFAIIDSSRVRRVNWDQLADYVAMAGLSNVDLDADIGSAPSILRLFAQVPPPRGLSNWDASYLKALYHSDQRSRSQRVDIVAKIISELER